MLEEAYRMIGVRDGLREVKVPMAQAIVRALAVNAVKGQQRAQRLFTELLTTTEREKRREQYEVLESLLDYKRTWDRELARRAQLGIVAPDPVPHPDHIRIDLWRRHLRDQRADQQGGQGRSRGLAALPSGLRRWQRKPRLAPRRGP